RRSARSTSRSRWPRRTVSRNELRALVAQQLRALPARGRPGPHRQVPGRDPATPGAGAAGVVLARGVRPGLPGPAVVGTQARDADDARQPPPLVARTPHSVRPRRIAPVHQESKQGGHMPKTITTELPEVGERLFDAEEKLFADIQATPGGKAFVFLHTVPYEGSVGLVNLLTTTRLIRKGFDVSVILY